MLGIDYVRLICIKLLYCDGMLKSDLRCWDCTSLRRDESL